ncbi:hypothetical protein ACQPZF_34515 [Actinosynnema sp. CS-041913]|uniref:hypothetical protein n=1 Tax=Actinosynnema sp. CS-041913 TaxID=3239917 RepID=UPI003D8CE020
MSSVLWRKRGRLEDVRRRRRPGNTAVEPRVLAVRALRSLRFGEVCPHEAHDGANTGRLVSATLSLSALIGLFLHLVVVERFDAVVASGAVGGVYLLSVAPGVLGMDRKLGWLAVQALWLAALMRSIAEDLSALVMVTHLLPVALVFLGRWAMEAAELALRVPLFVPAALVLVLAPLFTEDPWQFAAAAGWRVALVALAVVPLAALVVARFRRLPLTGVFDRAAADVAGNADEWVDVAGRMLRSRCLTTEHWPPARQLERFLRPSFEHSSLRADAARLRDLAGDGFRRQLRARFGKLLVGTTAITYALVYLLTVVAMPAALAEDWSKASVTTARVDGVVPWVAFDLPLWPYAGVAALFSAVAAVGFLTFCLTDETYTTTMADAVAGRPARLLIIMGAPYLFDGAKAAPVPVDPAPDPTPKPAPRLNRNGKKAGR